MKALHSTLFFSCVLWGLLLGSAGVRAQGGPPPAAARPDTAQLWQALQQAEYLVQTDTAQAGRRIRQALAGSQRVGFAEGTALAYLLLGRQRNDLGQPAAALRLYQSGLQVLHAVARRRPTRRVRTSLSMTLNAIGVVQRSLGQLAASVTSCQQAIDYALAAQNYDGLVLMYSNLAGCFDALGQVEQQREYLYRSLALRQRALHRPEQLLAPYTNLAILLIEQGRRPEAWRCLAQARPLLALPRATPYVANYERASGIYFFEEGRYPEARGSFRRALHAVEQAGKPGRAAELYLALARTARALGDVPAAGTEFRHALGLARRTHNRLLEARLLDELAGFEETQGPGRAPAALAYFKQLKALQEALGQEETKRTVLKLEAQYRTRQQQQQIRALRAQRQVQQLALRRKTLLSYAALALVGLLLGTMALAYTVLRTRHKLAAHRRVRKLRERMQQRQYRATEAMLHGQDAERSRIAHDLHDGLGGLLSAVKYYLGTLRDTLVLPAASAELFAHSLSYLDASIGELRRVAHDMMPGALLQFGLVPALQDLCEAFNHRAPQHVQFQAYGLAERLPQRTEIVVYRLVQELLNNAVKHADAEQIIVQLTRNGRQVQGVVEDNGCGSTPATARPGMGMQSIQARVDYLRGTLDWQSQPGQGTTATFDFSLPDA